MTRIPSILLTLMLMSGPALASEGDAILARARSRAAAEDFQPYRYHLVAHTWVRNGDDELEHEELSREEHIQWSPDSSEVVHEETELIFSKEDGESENDEEGEEDGEELDLSFDFLSPGQEKAYRIDFRSLVERGDQALAEFRVRPRKPSKENWKGRIYLNPDSGALRGIDVEPAKGRFGLKRMRVRMKMAEALGMDLPLRIDIDIEIKVILIFHQKIETRIEFAHMEAM